MAEQKNYADWTFEPDANLEASVSIFQEMKSFIQDVVKDNTKEFTKARFVKQNKKTGKIAKGKVKNEEDYETLFSPNNTFTANSEYYFTELAKRALYLEDLLNKVVAKNIDNGRGILIEDLKKKQQQLQQPNLEKVE